MTNLPELPEPLKEVHVVRYHDSALCEAMEDYFDAEQMRAYAREAIAQATTTSK